VFENYFSDVEALPMKHMGNDYVDASRNYSHNIEHQFKQFMSEMIYKDELDDVYAFGKGIQHYLRLKENNEVQLTNTIEYLETAMEMQLKGRRQMEFRGGFVKRGDNFTRSKEGNLYKHN